MLLYYLATTFSEEVELFWRSGLGVGAIIFYTNRNLMAVYQILSPAGTLRLSFKVCEA